MKRWLRLCGAILSCSCAILIFDGQGLHAGEQLINADLHGVPGKVVLIQRFNFNSGFAGGRHLHTGHVFVYVLEGTLLVEMDNKAPYTVKAGELFQELPNEVMRVRNISSTAPVKLLVFQVSPKGEPLIKMVY